MRGKTERDVEVIRSNIYGLPDRHAELADALPEALELACALPDWKDGRARIVSSGPAEEAWMHAQSHTEWPDSTEPHHSSAGPEESSELPLTVDARGSQTVARLIVRAEFRPVAELELVGGDAVDRLDLRMLLSRLELIATRERSRAAVRKAADLVRKRASAQATPDGVAGTAEGPSPFGYEGTGRHEITGLPRGHLLEDRMAMALRRRRRGGGGLLAVMHVEPGLVDPADSAGLAAIARRLIAGVREVDTVGHGPDGGFVIITEDLARLEAARELAERMQTAVSRPLRRQGEPRSAVRIGLVVGGVGYDEPGEIFRDARLAAHDPEADGEVRLLDQLERRAEEDRALLESELRRALKHDELLLEYQPTISLESGRIVGMEAFVRWDHPKVGRIPPAEFVNAAADSPLMHELGFWVIDRVCRQIVEWQAIRGAGRIPPVDVNVHRVQLADPGFSDRLLATQGRHGLPGESLRLDVTEGDLMDSGPELLEVLVRLRRQGVLTVIDDFGTGPTSLRRLGSLPVAGIKLDGAFLPEPDEGIEGWTTARAIAQLGSAFALEVTAEAVEHVGQIETLRRIGCQRAQGYAIASPSSDEDVLALMQEGIPLDFDFVSD